MRGLNPQRALRLLDPTDPNTLAPLVPWVKRSPDNAHALRAAWPGSPAALAMLWGQVRGAGLSWERTTGQPLTWSSLLTNKGVFGGYVVVSPLGLVGAWSPTRAADWACQFAYAWGVALAAPKGAPGWTRRRNFVGTQKAMLACINRHDNPQGLTSEMGHGISRSNLIVRAARPWSAWLTFARLAFTCVSAVGPITTGHGVIYTHVAGKWAPWGKLAEAVQQLPPALERWAFMFATIIMLGGKNNVAFT